MAVYRQSPYSTEQGEEYRWRYTDNHHIPLNEVNNGGIPVRSIGVSMAVYRQSPYSTEQGEEYRWRYTDNHHIPLNKVRSIGGGIPTITIFH